ncbi:hypothetical protein BKA70DRAFT_1238175 [Coprinopsis sp. MPI-PUGE-AT-0042]|nr:hypothetical protein BKA70DRAFT_1238175 [Coprinopsis sp. MPI-PUGE-AT-0042]
MIFNPGEVSEVGRNCNRWFQLQRIPYPAAALDFGLLGRSEGHPWTPTQAMHSPLTDAADAQSAADGSPTSPEREGHQGYERLLLEEEGPDKEGEGRGEKADREGESSKAPEDKSREEEPELSSDGELIFEHGIDLSRLERMQQISDEPNLKLSPIMGATDSTTTKKPDDGQAWARRAHRLVAPIPSMPVDQEHQTWTASTSTSMTHCDHPPATSPLGYNGTNRITKARVMHHRGPPSSSRVHTGERASIRVVERLAARLDPVMDLFDKNGSILGSTWAEAYPRRTKILRITPECSTTHLPGSKCVPDVDAERMIPQSLAFTILSAKSEWRFGFVTLLSMNGTDSNTRRLKLGAPRYRSIEGGRNSQVLILCIIAFKTPSR